MTWCDENSVLFQNLSIYFRKSDKGNTLICVGSSESLARQPADETQQVPKINTEMEMSRHRDRTRLAAATVESEMEDGLSCLTFILT